MMEEKKRPPVGIFALLAPLALCLPCLLLPLGLVAGAVGFSAIGAWFGDNAVVVGLAGAAALALATAAAVTYVRRSKAAACDVNEGSVSSPPRTRPLSELDRR